MPPRILITGFGLITPLGFGAWETFRALLAGRSITDRAADLPGDVPPLEIPKALGSVGVAQYGRVDPVVELAERCAREAAAMSGVSLKDLPTFMGTSKGAVARLSIKLGRGLPLDDQDHRNIALGPHAYLASELQRRTGLCPMAHHVAACASSLYALDAARRAIIAGRCDRALVLTADSALTPAFISSYRRLGVLAQLTPAEYRQRPLDKRRQGFMLSEMGAAVLLQREDHAKTPAPGSLELVNTAVACEAYDMIRTAPSMPALKNVVDRLIPGRPIDAFHPHAPGTPDHDAIELSTLLSACQQIPDGPENTPDIYALKGAIGHGLGAAALTSFVVAALCLTTGKRPPMPWLTQPIEELSEQSKRLDLGAPDADLIPKSPKTETHNTSNPTPRPSDPTPIRPDGPVNRSAATAQAGRTVSRSGSHAVFAAGFGGHTAGAVLRRHT